MRIFIDDFQLLRIESHDYIYDIKLDGYEVKWLRNEDYNQYFTVNEPLALHIVDHIIINGHTYPLEIGRKSIRHFVYLHL
jgi:pullulanase